MMYNVQEPSVTALPPILVRKALSPDQKLVINKRKKGDHVRGRQSDWSQNNAVIPPKVVLNDSRPAEHYMRKPLCK